MNKQTFSVNINAPKEKVWNVLWDDKTYRAWTATFHEGSHAESDWKEGSKILFLGPDRSGMTSKIEQLIPNRFMSFKHMGVIKDGVEDFTAAEAKKWSGALENYTLEEKENTTRLTVEVDVADEYSDHFLESFPKALQKVKELSETNS